ncbi:CR3L2 protein, partial [Polypterus senegalus]|nr:cyclic AMP-responsive element-binding protein 3-like protein 2 isoform X1 [Polypterus senegalus]MBN3292454.1 CR3L2 protein [Polypterus senegalus]
MEILDSGEPLLHWDRNLCEMSDGEDQENTLYATHFSELLDDFSQDAILGQLLSDPFLSDRSEAMDTEEDLAESPVPPHIKTEHSYSLCGDSRPQSPLTHLAGEEATDGEEDSVGASWPMESTNKALKMEPLLCETPSLLPTLTLNLAEEAMPSKMQASTFSVPILITPPAQIKDDSDNTIPEIKLEPHEVDQFLNISPKGLEPLQLPPTPPSSHGSDSEGSQSPTRSCATPSPTTPVQSVLKVASRTPSSLANSPLLTAAHKLQGTGPLMLTEEEKRTLIAEGYPVPNKLPLTKAEEKALKKIRRKIKNKISAQESRRKKKEYMDTLEKKVETCSNENTELRRKVETLESTNRSLLQQLQCLQAVVAGKVPRSCRIASTQTSTCLMVVVLCFAVFLGGFSQSFGPYSSITMADLPSQTPAQESYTATVRSRSLLGFKEHSGFDEPHPSILSTEYSEAWDRQKDLESQQFVPSQKSDVYTEDRQTEYLNYNNTQTEKSILIDLHSHRSHMELRTNESRKVIEIERMVNKTS